MNQIFNKSKNTLIAIGLFLLVSCVYFMPVLQGKKIIQADIQNFNGAATETRAYPKTHNGESALWTGTVFSGMPTYQISVHYPYNIAGKILQIYNSILPNPISLAFLYFIGMFILLRVLKVDVWLSIIGSLAFGFTSYNFIIIEAGHISKCMVVGLFAPLMAGIILVFQKDWLKGGTLATLSLALQLKANHFQMTYYLGMSIAIMAVVYGIYAFRNKAFVDYIKAGFVLVGAVIIAAMVNSGPLLLTNEYASETIRGNSELTLGKTENSGTSGLDRSYAFEYSYGVGETFTLIIPRFYGGASTGDIEKGSNTYNALKTNNIPNADKVVKQQIPSYWGDQLFTSGPTYFGVIIIFLFLLGLFIVKSELKWWAAATFALMVLLSWGKNFPILSNWFFDHMPIYNKFRAVSSILTVASMVAPVLAVLALKNIIETNTEVEKAKLISTGKKVLIGLGGILLMFCIMPGIAGDFMSKNDANLPEFLKEAVVADRESLLRSDAFRSLGLVLAVAAALYFYLKNKLQLRYLYIVIGLLVLTDMYGVCKRYLNDDNFKSKREASTELVPSAADTQILQDTTDYRVFNTTVSSFNDNSTSYFHRSIGGYSAAKLKRYQEVIENHLSKGNMSVFNMLNAKYFIVQDQQTGQPQVQTNPGACGSAWLISNYKIVANADSEMLALNGLDSKNTVVIDQRYKDYVVNMSIKKDSTSKISLLKYDPMVMTYNYEGTSENFAVFSEIYYSKGWNAYIDDKLTDYIRVNYLLRGLKIPAGKHKVVFKFEPKTRVLTQKVDLAGSILLSLLVLTTLGIAIFKAKKA